jgi:DNA recombination protein RmuC
VNVEIANVVSAVSLTVAVIAIILLIVVWRHPASSTGVATDPEQIRSLGAELTSLREGKAEAERHLAAEERTASRVPDLERDVALRLAQIDALKEAKGATERELASVGEGLAQTKEALEESRRRILDLGNEAKEMEKVLGTVRNEKANAEESLAGKFAALQLVETQLADLKTALETERAAQAIVRKEAADYATKLAAAEEKLEQELKQASEKLALLTEARGSMTNEFKVLAEDVMARHGVAFTKQNKEQVEGILKPLQEKLVEFQQGLQVAQTETVKDRATLAEHIRHLTDASAKMTNETQNLTRALKGKAQTQGAWGEMILSTILERSGLREGEEYVKQESYTGEDGSRLRPDVVVNLPGGQKVVIDSKVSLTAFEEFVNAGTEEDRISALARHLGSMKTHIRALGAKEYHSAVGSALDYVVMFVPIEGALAVALQEEPGMTGIAVEANVAIATPTTLMIALRTIANVWQVERRNKNAEEIAARAGKIYDKFVGFLDDMTELGGRLDQAKESFHGAMGKLSDGRGNIVRQVEQLKGLGAKTTKAIPSLLLEEAAPEARHLFEVPEELAESVSVATAGNISD